MHNVLPNKGKVFSKNSKMFSPKRGEKWTPLAS